MLLLSNNNFVTFPPQLEQFHKLEKLDLSGNHLNSRLPSYLEDQNIHTLNLSNNNYETWINNGHRYNFKKLDLSKNKINTIENGAFILMSQLTFLDLSENRIYDLNSMMFTENPHLDTLILSRNYFSKIPTFNSQSLRSLRLSSCQITTMDRDDLRRMNSLLEMDLSINQIEEIPDELNSNTLQELNLSYNEIYTLTDRTFISLPHLAVLDLRGNNFKEVWPTSHFSSNPFLREVLVKGNRWSCEGFSVNLLLTYEFLTKEPPKISDPAALICYSPVNVTQMSWQQAYILTWHPTDGSPESFTMIAVMIGVIIGIILTSMVCRGIMAINKQEPPRPLDTTVVSLNGPTPRVESVVMRIPLRDEDLPPTYDEALLMPRLNSSFHSLPDFVDEEDDEPSRRFRRSRSIGDLTEYRPRTVDRRSMRRTVEINVT